ncbi:MAG: hypothetical protein WDN25_13235 [Acetobacteraceae bacterium]
MFGSIMSTALRLAGLAGLGSAPQPLRPTGKRGAARVRVGDRQYAPNGASETARRRRQIVAGSLRPGNGLWRPA